MPALRFARPALVAALGCLAAAPAVAQQTRSLVVRLGNDTVALERYTRFPHRIEGRQVLRSPSTSGREYRAFLRPDGSIARWELTFLDAELRPTGTAAAIDFVGDTAHVELRLRDRMVNARIPAPRGSVPWLLYSSAVYEPAIAYARSTGRSRLKAGMVPLGGNEAMPLEMRLFRDSAAITNIAGPNTAHLDASGGIRTFDALVSTEHFVAEPAPGLDLAHMAAEFAARDRAGRGLGSLTPLDTATARFGDAEVRVRYSRPWKRGRKIFGGLEPWGRVWRTGANAATHLTTSRDLVIGGVPVPAGTYTLFSIPSPERWTLIINRQTGQFGTDYDPKQDLARIPMTRDPLPAPVEQFTIALEPSPTGGRLALIWDDTRAWVTVEGK